MKNTIKKLMPYAVVGILSGATTFGAINYFNNNNTEDSGYFSTSKTLLLQGLMLLLVEMTSQKPLK